MEKNGKIGAGLIAGMLMALLALRQFVNFCRILRFQFVFAGLVGTAVLLFAAVVLLMRRRDRLLLIALGVLALDWLIWSNMVQFVAAALLLLLALVMTTDYLPQAKDLAQKIWFVPAILALIGSFVGIYRFTIMVPVWALVTAAAFALCGFWLVWPRRSIAELFGSAGAGKVSADGPAVVSAPAVDGYCDLFRHVLLLLVTFGIWNFIWIYRTTRYLNRVGGEKERTPVAELLLCMFVPLYMIYWTYQSARRADKLAAAVGVDSRLSVLCLILAVYIPVVPVVLLQDKINAVIGVEQGSRKADFDPAQRPSTVLKRDPESVDGYCGLFKHLLLMILTFGIWTLIWIYRTTGYLNRVEGEEQRNPVTKLLLCMFVPFYLIYWVYKSCQRIDRLGGQTGVKSDLTVLCLILSVVAGNVPFILMQNKINEIIVGENSAVAAAEPPAIEAPAEEEPVEEAPAEEESEN